MSQYCKDFEEFIKNLPELAACRSHFPERVYMGFGIVMRLSLMTNPVFEISNLKRFALKIIKLSLSYHEDSRLEYGLNFLLKNTTSSTPLLNALKDYGFSISSDGALVPIS